MSRMKWALLLLGLMAAGGFLANQTMAEPKLAKWSDLTNKTEAGIDRDFDHAALSNEKTVRIVDLQTMFMNVKALQEQLLAQRDDEDSDLGELAAEEDEELLTLDQELKQTEAELKELHQELEQLDKQEGEEAEIEAKELKREIRELEEFIKELKEEMANPEEHGEHEDGFDEDEYEEGGLGIHIEIDGEEIDIDELPTEILDLLLDRTANVRDGARRGLLGNLRGLLDQLEDEEELEYEYEQEEEFDDERYEEHDDEEWGRERPELKGMHHRLERLFHAAELLEEAGEHEQAEKLFKKAERLEKELDKRRHGHHEGSRKHDGHMFESIFKELRSIKEELQDVHREVQEIKELIKQNQKESGKV